MTEQENNNRNIKKLKENLITPFCGWGSIGSRLQSHYEKTLLFTTKSVGGPGTHLIDFRRMKG